MKLAALGVLAALLAVSAEARADDTSCELRVEAAHRTLSEGARRTGRWYYGWTAGMAAVTVGQGAAIPFVDREDRLDLYVGGASGLVGLLTLVLMPPTVLEDAPRFEARLAEPDRCLLARDGERFLERAAKSDASTTGIWAHIGNAAFNLGIGAIIGFGFGHWTSAFLNVGAGIAVGEAMLLTYPNTNSPYRASNALFTF